MGPQICVPPPYPLYERFPGHTVSLLSSLLCLRRCHSFWRRVPFLAPLVVLAVPLIGLGALRISAVTFGGIGGDIVGATGEVCRAVVLVALSAMI